MYVFFEGGVIIPSLNSGTEQEIVTMFYCRLAAE